MNANTIIEAIGQEFAADPQGIDFICATRIAGDHNKETRRQIIKLITGEHRPISKCGLYAAADVLKNYFSQPKLF